MSAIVDPILHESAGVYQAKAAEHLTSHQLADFRRCPLLYRKKKLGLVEDEDRPAYLVGRALHTLVLEGRQRFEQEYAVGGPVNPKTGELYGSSTKAFAQWAAQQGKPVLTMQQCELVERMAEAVRGHGLARDLLPLSDRLVNAGVAVLLLAHAARRSITTIDGIELDKSAPEIHPDLANTTIEWSDFVGAICLVGPTVCASGAAQRSARSVYWPRRVPGTAYTLLEAPATVQL